MPAILQADPTDVWRKPRHVTLDSGYLVADVQQESRYPILEAAHDGRALRGLIDARTEDEVCQFTMNWGFLHVWFGAGRRDRFPLALFRLHRQYFLALARLSSAVRSRAQDREIKAALLALKTTQAEREAYVYQRQPNRVLDGGLTESEQALADQGVPTTEPLLARGESNRTVPLPEYAARTLASELNGLQRLRPVRNGRQWAFEEIPIVYSLEQILRWSVRSRYQVLHHYLCESCGGESINWRADARFCSPECGTRARVQRFRQRQKATASRARSRRRHKVGGSAKIRAHSA